MGQYIFRAVIVAITVMMVFLFDKGISRHNTSLVGAVVLWGPILLLCLNMDLLLLTTIALFASGLQFPGLPNDLVIYHILVIAFIGVVVLRILMQHAIRARGGGAYRLLLMAFAAVILVTMYFRGAGFRVLGDSMWGGMRYVTMLLGIAMVEAVPYAAISERRLKTGLKWMCILALLPFIAEVGMLMYGEKAGYIALFIHSQRSIDSVGASLDDTRLFAGYTASVFLVMLPFILQASSGKHYRMLTGVCVFVAYAMAMLSGHRISILAVTLFLFGYVWISGKVSKPFIVAMSLFGVVSGYLVLLFFASDLPESVQRSISWVPFVKINTAAAMDAYSTIDWRVHVWKDAIREIPKYFWLGKGYTFDPLWVRSLMMSGHYVRDWAIVESAYHNGHLSLLIGLGIFGYITGIGSVLLIFKRHLGLLKGSWNRDVLRQLHLIVFIHIAIKILIFLVIYGDAYVSLPTIMFFTMVLELIRRADSDAGETNGIDVEGARSDAGLSES